VHSYLSFTSLSCSYFHTDTKEGMISITLMILNSRMWAGVWGHGAVVFPPPRNNIDYGEAPWDAEVPRPVPAVSDPKNGVWCPIPNPFFNNNLTGISSF